MRILDAYAHALPRRYLERVDGLLADSRASDRVRAYHPFLSQTPALAGLPERWRDLEGVEDYRQILVLGIPPVEELGPPSLCRELAQLANDELGQLVAAHPDRFAGFAAGLPLNDVEASLEELDRAVETLGALGIQVYSNVGGRPLDDPSYQPVFARVAELGRAIWLHPARATTSADYETEASSRFGLWWALGWPFETSLAMARLVHSGLFDRHPELPVVAHHGGAMIPFFSERLEPLDAELASAAAGGSFVDRFRAFYADTIIGTPAALRCSIDFFGVDRVLFGTDMPFGGPGVVHEAIATLNALELPEADRAKIFHANAERVLLRASG